MPKIVISTHAPFVSREIRGWKLSLLANIYDWLIGKWELKQYDKVIAQTQWEIPSLLKLDCPRERIVISPNGVPDEFFDMPIKKGARDRLSFIGRVAPIKDLETPILAMAALHDKDGIDVGFEITGPKEEGYYQKLWAMVADHPLEGMLMFNETKTGQDKLDWMNEQSIFVLPSKREAMPQSLIEAMALGKIVVASKTDGAKEIIVDGVNGLLFDIGDYDELSLRLAYCFNNFDALNRMRFNARKSVEHLKWSNIGKEVEKIYGI